MPKIRFALGIAFLLWSAGALSGQCDIADQCGDLQPQGGFGPNSPTFFCEGEEVEFINNSDPNLVDTTIIDWGDGQVDRAPGTPSFTHTYDFAEDTCLVSASSVTIPITMTVVNRCPSGVSRNCLIVFVRIRVNPVAIFDEPEALCVGEVANFMNASCDNGETVTYEWTFEGNGTSTDENPSVIYNQRGFYDIGLRVTNQCGTDFTQETIEIRDVPIAAATSQISNDSACIPALIQFMNNSIDEDFYEWQFFPSQGVVFLDSTETGFFPEGGHYQALLIAENTCGIDTARLNFEVFEPPSLLLGPAPPPGCDTLVFTPDITYEGSISSLEWAFPGSNIALTTDSFPTVIYTDDGVYPYTLNVSGPCGAFSIRDTVQVLALEEVAFDSIGLVCNSTDPFPIPASPPLGVWSGPGVGSNGLFDPAAANIGTNVLTYVAGAAGCESTGQLTIEVEEAADVDIGTARDTFCVDAGQVTFSFSPIGGAWSGTGIVDPSQGVFDPQLAGPGTYNLSYVFGDAIGCVIRKTKNVRVEALPDITLNGMPSTCAVSDNISLSDVVNFQATPGGTLTWSGDGVLNPSGQFNSDSLFGAMSADITLTNTSAFGCVTSQTFTLELRDYIQAQAAEPEVTACSGSAPLMLSATPGNGQWAGPQANANTGEVLISQLSPGTYFYIYTIDPNTPCESRDTVELTVLDAANSVTLGQDVYACADDNVVPLPAASPMNGDWTGPSPASNGQVDVQLLPGPGEYIYTYTVDALPDACNSAEITFTVLPLPEPAFTFDSLACEGAPVSFTNETANADVFSWDFGDGSPLSNEVSPQHAFGQSNTFTVMLTAESLNPLDGSVVCSAQLDQDIYVSQAPELVAFNTDVVEGCAPLAVSFDNQSVGDNLSFIWNFGGLDTSFVDEPGLFTFPQGIFGDTSYTVTLSVANGCGDAVDTTQILVFPQPQANFGITFNELCSGDTLYLNNISTGNPDQYFWFMNSRTLERIYSIPDPPPVVPFSDVTADTLSVLLIAQNGCGSDSLEQLVTVNPSDVSALINTSTRELCVNDTVRLESFSTPGAPVRWTISDGNVYTGTVVQHSFAAPGVYNVSLYAEGCGADSMAVQIAVLPLPDVALNFSPTVCAENPLRFDVVTNGDGQVLYFGDGDSTLSSVAQHIYDTPGTYFPTVTVTSAQGCRNTWNGIALEVAPLPVVAIAEVDSVCQGAPVNFRSLSIGNTSCLWLFGDGNGSDACEAIHTFQSSGVFDASLIAVSSLGCRDSLKQPVYVRPRPEADFEVSLEDICTPATVLFSDNSTGATGLSWELGDGSTGTASEFSHIYETAGDYEARLIVSNEGICRDTTTQQFTLYSPPEGNFELIETCTQAEGHTLLVEAEPQDFVVLNGRDYNQAGTRHERLAAGSYTLELESPQGCYTTREIVVPQVQELIALLFQDSFAIELGQSVDLLVNINQAGTQIRWSPAMSLSDTSITDPVATPFSTTTYVVEVTNDKGCVKRDTALVRVAIDRERGIFIPNAFTPDGSGHNDVFRILSTNVGLVKVPVFRVFDRWGELMFEALDCPASELQNCGWDGNFKGQKAEQGVYTYYAELLFTDSFLRVAKGNVTLIR